MNSSRFKNRLYSIIEDNSTVLGRRFDFFIQFLIILSLIAFSIETLPDLPPKVVSLLYYIELISIIIFSIEYMLRIYVAKNRWGYIFSFYGLIDLVAILPFYLNKFVDLRFIRAFRIFRIFRALKLVRYSAAMKRFERAFTLIREELILFFICSAILIFLTASGIYFFESEAQPDHFKSVFHSFWWSIVTLTTVGYGDIYPITTGGRVFTFFVLIIGVGIVTVPAGLVATALSKARQEELGNA